MIIHVMLFKAMHRFKIQGSMWTHFGHLPLDHHRQNMDVSSTRFSSIEEGVDDICFSSFRNSILKSYNTCLSKDSPAIGK